MTDFTHALVVGVSSRALFDLEKENDIYRTEGMSQYRQMQREKENDVLLPGTAYHLVEALLNLNGLSENRLVEVIIMSSNSPETGVRILNSIKSLGLDITRSAFTGGEKISGYMEAFGVDLFLSMSEEDVQEVIDSGTAAAALILEAPLDFKPETETVRIAFDADAVLFSEESEAIYKAHGIDAFQKNEADNENVPLKMGPYGKLLMTLSKIQKYMNNGTGLTPLRLAIVTSRNSPAHMRVIKTLREWDVYVDEVFFLGGMPKDKILKAFNAHIFFDDQDVHLDVTKKVVPSGKVPYSTDSSLRNTDAPE